MAVSSHSKIFVVRLAVAKRVIEGDLKRAMSM